MNKLFVLILMIFFHIIDDFYLQIPWLASGKQKKYWQDNAPEKLYKYDYIWALIMHSFSWSFMIMLPIAIYNRFEINSLYIAVLFANAIFHAYIDNAKANKKIINLWADQLLHMCQIMWALACC